MPHLEESVSPRETAERRVKRRFARSNWVQRGLAALAFAAGGIAGTASVTEAPEHVQGAAVLTVLGAGAAGFAERRQAQTTGQRHVDAFSRAVGSTADSSERMEVRYLTGGGSERSFVADPTVKKASYAKIPDLGIRAVVPFVLAAGAGLARANIAGTPDELSPQAPIPYGMATVAVGLMLYGTLGRVTGDAVEDGLWAQIINIARSVEPGFQG